MIGDHQTASAPARYWAVYASYVVTFGMVFCFADVAAKFLLWLVPGWQASGVSVICALAALEAFISHWLKSRSQTAQKQIIYYRLTEWIILFVIVKFFVEMRNGAGGFWSNVLLWPSHFPDNILTTDYLLMLLPVFATWLVSDLFATDLFLLGSEDASHLDERLKQTSIRTLILRRFLNLGIVVVVLAAIPPQSALPLDLPIASNRAFPAILMYFVLGLALLSLVRYISLATTWRQAKVQVQVQIPRRWFTYSVLILAVLALLISSLPTDYGMGFFATLNAVMQIIYQIVATIYSFFALIVALIARLLTPSNMVMPQQIAPVATPPPESLPPASPTGINWNLISSVIFWLVLVVLVVIALRQYIAFHRDLSDELKHFRPLSWLLTAWERFKATFRKANKSVGIFIQNGIKRLRSLGATPPNLDEWDYINPHRLSSREKIIFYYLALVRRAREAGLPRREGDTPYEYARSLTSNLEEGKEGVQAITESFVEARYTRHNISAEDARRANSTWEAIRHALHNVRKARQEDKPKHDKTVSIKD